MRYVILPVLLLAALAAGADVGVDTILAPVGTVDSGQLVTPRCIVANYADSVSNVKAHFGIFDAGGVIYLDSLTITGLAAGARETVAFTAWEPQCRDSLLAKAWTTCAGDTNPLNDTCSQRFFVRIIDIALFDLWPAGETFDSGEVIVPHVRAWSFANVTTSFVLWSDTITLAPGRDTVVYGDTVLGMPGIWVITAIAIVPGDLHPENNYLSDTFYVRGTIVHEVGIRILMPDTEYASQAFTPAARVTNLTGNTESFWSKLFIYDSARTRRFYAESLQVMVGGHDSAIVYFPTTAIADTGPYVAIGVVPGEPSLSPSDTHYFWVVPGSGVEERGQPTAYSSQPTATVLTASSLKRLASSVVFDAMGRRVTNPRPGIYFVREPSAVSGQPSAVRRKVILQR